MTLEIICIIIMVFLPYTLFFNLKLFIVFVGRGPTNLAWHTCEGQRTTFTSSFSPYTM